MGLFSSRKNRDLTAQPGQPGEDSTQEGGEQEKKKGGFLSALFASDKYRKSPEEREAEKEKKQLSSRLGNLKIKRYNRSMNFRYNDNKKRIEVGENFEMKKLPEIVYLLADGSTVFRRDIGGRFDLKDREELRRIIRRNKNKVRKMERALNEGNERRQVIYLKELF